MEKTMAPHSSTLAWNIPWTEKPGRLQSMGSQRVGHDWATSLSLFTFLHWRRKWQPTRVLAWRIPGTGEPGGLPSMGSHRVRHDWSDLAAAAGCKYNGCFFWPVCNEVSTCLLLLPLHSIFQSVFLATFVLWDRPQKEWGKWVLWLNINKYGKYYQL